MLLEGKFEFEELKEYASKWVANPGKPLIDADCKMINQNHQAAALVFDFAKYFKPDMENIKVAVTKAGMKEHIKVDVGMMTNYDFAVFRFCLDYM